MANWIQNHWEFLIGEVLIPIILFVIGFFSGKVYEKKKITKANASIKGNYNTVNQNNKINFED